MPCPVTSGIVTPGERCNTWFNIPKHYLFKLYFKMSNHPVVYFYGQADVRKLTHVYVGYQQKIVGYCLLCVWSLLIVFCRISCDHLSTREKPRITNFYFKYAYRTVNIIVRHAILLLLSPKLLILAKETAKFHQVPSGKLHLLDVPAAIAEWTTNDTIKYQTPTWIRFSHCLIYRLVARLIEHPISGLPFKLHSGGQFKKYLSVFLSLFTCHQEVIKNIPWIDTRTGLFLTFTHNICPDHKTYWHRDMSRETIGACR